VKMAGFGGGQLTKKVRMELFNGEILLLQGMESHRKLKAADQRVGWQEGKKGNLGGRFKYEKKLWTKDASSGSAGIKGAVIYRKKGR